MTRLILACALFFCCVIGANAQSVPDETAAVKSVITALFDGMRKGDSSIVSRTFAPGMIMQTITSAGAVRTDDPAGFLKMVGTPRSEVYDERITFDQVLIDANLASVWTSYKFYIGDKFSHCGVNSFQLVKGASGWKVVHIIDTRRRENCGQ